MRIMLLIFSTAALTALSGSAQDQTTAQTSICGRGRGGAPFAWNDKDKDGVCDVTGRPAGQGRPIGWARGRGGSQGRPNAYGDRNKDGICDYTGKPVGQRRGATAGRGSAAEQPGPGIAKEE